MAHTTRTILQNALRTYGADEQMRMTTEECAELIKALSKFHRTMVDSKAGKKAKDAAEMNVIEEIADVQIMCEQMAIYFGACEVEDEKAMKIKRLAERMAGLRSKKTKEGK